VHAIKQLQSASAYASINAEPLLTDNDTHKSMDEFTINTTQINAILDAAYGLTNTLGVWTKQPDDPSDLPALEALALINVELKVLVDACPDMSERAHNPEEIQRVVSASVNLIEKMATSFPNIDRVPEFLRNDVKKVYWAINNAGLIQAAE